jgi:hypothetical protein
MKVITRTLVLVVISWCAFGAALGKHNFAFKLKQHQQQQQWSLHQPGATRGSSPVHE